MSSPFVTGTHTQTIPIYPLKKDAISDWAKDKNHHVKQWIEATSSSFKSGDVRLIPTESGDLGEVLFGVGDSLRFWDYGALPAALPHGVYTLQLPHGEDLFLPALAWGLAHYRFDRYRSMSVLQTQLYLPDSVNLTLLNDWIDAIQTLRDWVNTPVEDMGPPELAEAVTTQAERYGATVNIISGEALLAANYPTIHRVGRAGQRPPHFIDVQWGEANHPKVTLVGKGVCFDSGGLDLKPAANMLNMKKDMAGAAHAFALGRMIMSQKLPVRLRVLIPAVENFVSANAYRPGDIIKTRSGKTVEVTNTDAEGRLVLCDALSEAVSEAPDVLIDFATLTGAATVALGPEVPAFFCQNESMAQGILSAAETVQDPMWRMPLYQRYFSFLKSPIADFANSSSVPHAGAITAALFLQKFVPSTIPWAHFDLYAWQGKAEDGKMIGAEAMTLRAVYAWLEATYSKN